MAGICNVNAVLSGHLDYYCLVCKDLFRSIEDVEQHVETPHHQKLLKQAEYVEQYGEDRIRQVKQADKNTKAFVGNPCNGKKNETQKPPIAYNKQKAQYTSDSGESPQEFARANDMTHEEGDKQVFCNICIAIVPFNIKNMKQHVAGIAHKSIKIVMDADKKIKAEKRSNCPNHKAKEFKKTEANKDSDQSPGTSKEGKSTENRSSTVKISNKNDDKKPYKT